MKNVPFIMYRLSITVNPESQSANLNKLTQLFWRTCQSFHLQLRRRHIIPTPNHTRSRQHRVFLHRGRRRRRRGAVEEGEANATEDPGRRGEAKKSVTGAKAK